MSMTTRLVLALTCALASCLAAYAEEPDLFAELREADPARAAQIEREIERTWSLSGSTTVDMLYRRGQDALEAGDYRLAIEHFTAVTDHAPEFAEGWHARATAYFQVDKFGPALDDIGHALRLNPQNWNALYGFGILMREIEEFALAEEAFRRALELHPHHERASEALKQIARFGVGQTL